MIYDTIIIGAGPAGLMAGAFSKGNVLLLEGNQNLGRKLLITGAGQCNFSHSGDIDDFINKYGKNGKFLKSALYNFNNKKVVEFFKNMNIESFENDNGKIFPTSLKAHDILDALILKIKDRGILIKSNRKVLNINRQTLFMENEDKEVTLFHIKTNLETYSARKLIITTGGKSYPQTGSDGSMFSILQNMGITIEKLYPALTPVFVKNYTLANLSGISFKNAIINLYRGNRKIESHKGDILLTHKNLSGPGILDFSRYIRENDILKINFLGMNENIARKKIYSLLEHGKSKSVKSVMKELKLPIRFLEYILQEADISTTLNCSSVKKSQINDFMKCVLNYSFEVEKLAGYNIAMATTGGVDLSYVNKKTMESKEIKNLFFAGEVLDIDGNTGGYNIQAAFSTGRMAAIHANKK